MTLIEEPQTEMSAVDKCGAVASSLCAIHCLLCALFPAVFSLLGLGVLLGQKAEWIFTLIAIGFALVALVFSWRRYRSVAVATLLVLGIAGLLTSRVLEMGGDHHHGHHGHHEKTHHDKHGSKDHAHKEHAHKDHDHKAHEHKAHKHDSNEHHGHHHDKKDDHAKTTASTDHKDHHKAHKNHHEAHHDEHKEKGHQGHKGHHDDSGHLIGALVGVLAGLLLFAGHLLNLREMRRRKQDECC